MRKYLHFPHLFVWFTHRESLSSSGVMVPPIEMVTAQGYDLQFGTNVLGHYLLTNLLLPTIESTAKETGRPGRVIEVSSIMHVLSGNPIIHFETLKDGLARKRMRVDALYSQSKSVSTLARVAYIVGVLKRNHRLLGKYPSH